MVITLVDITKLKNAQLAARNSEENFRALVTASAQTVWTTDAEGLVVEDSPSWRAFTGQSLEQFRGSGWADVVHPDDRDAALQKWRKCLATQTPLDAEFRVRHADDGWRWTHARAVPLRDEAGKLRGWVGMNADVTERKATEAAQATEAALREANRRKDEFLALLGHELRNPLAPLRNAMMIFDRKLPADSELRKVRDLCERQLLHLIHLVDELLDVARIGSGRMRLTIKRVDLPEIVRAAVATFEFAARERGHQLLVDECPEPLEVDGDEVRLAQIVTNLLDNAVKYTRERGRIRLSLRRDGRDAVLSIADTGVGLSPEALANIFDVFNQGDASFEDRNGGLGLGLTLVRRLAELHGGSAQALSAGPGKGSEFIVRLPLAAKKTETARPDQSETGPVPALTARRVLLVEDNTDAAESLKQVLEMDGHQVLVAHDGSTGLKLAAEHAPEIVLLDIGLPGMDGYEVARRLRGLKQTSKALLIAATGFGQDTDRARSVEAGIDHHLVKPVDLIALQAIIRKRFSVSTAG